MVDGDRPQTGRGRRSSAGRTPGTGSTSGSQTPAAQQQQTAGAGAGASFETRKRPQPIQTEYGSITDPVGRQQQQQQQPGIDSPERSSKPKKPGMPRRATSTHIPKKGQEFSVDDAQEEVALDLTQQQKQQRQQPQRGQSQTLRRKPSTVRRKTSIQPAPLTTVESIPDEDGAAEQEAGPSTAPASAEDAQPTPSSEDTAGAEEDTSATGGDDDGSVSDAESFTLKDRQEAINVTHPFGIRIWKPALYKKDRSVQRNAEGDIHSSPGLLVSHWLVLFNIIWTLVFGWLLALVTAVGGLLCALSFTHSGAEYARLFFQLAKYLLYPFGKYVKLMQDEAYAEEDEGEGRSISEYEQWQSGDIEEGRLFFGPATGSLIGRRRNSIDSADETTSLLGRDGRSSLAHSDTARTKRRLFGRGKWNVGRVIFFVYFYGIFTPVLLLVSGLCWFLVFSIPMGKVTLLLFDQLRKHPLALSFHSDSGNVRRAGESSSILLCTYRAVGLKYWKYTIDGTNIFLINLLGLVAFTIFDYFVLVEALHLKMGITDQFFVFSLALLSIIPLAYFIGQAVASISAQSSMGVGATINAFFSTVVEVYLYCIALKDGKAQLVEGSIIGSIFAGVLFLPGLSMCFGALKRKTQRFNVKSAGVTSTMLLFAVIGAFGPTLFYQIYGSHELICTPCAVLNGEPLDRDCRSCYYSQIPAIHGDFFNKAVRPYTWLAATLLFLSYVIGLLFTLRTHAAVIWSTDIDEKKTDHMSGSQMTNSAHINSHFDYPHSNTLTRQGTSTSISRGAGGRADIRNTQLYKRIVGQSLQEIGLGPNGEQLPQDYEQPAATTTGKNDGRRTPHVVPPKDGDEHREHRAPSFHLPGLPDETSEQLVRQITELAATTSAIATREATKSPHRGPHPHPHHHSSALPHVKKHGERPHHHTRTPTATLEAEGEAPPGHASGGHDAPNWSRTKSAVILLTATIAYAIIAEILVNTVDAVLAAGDSIDEKFLGITLFALVPNTTEFLNAISFAMNGNIALSMEIGSAYALQVLLLQIPALVFYSAFSADYTHVKNILDHTFTLIFPQWDMVTVILCVFLLSYMYGEGKSNYFKGSILLLAYLVVIVGFYLSSFNDFGTKGVDPADTLALGFGVQRVKGMEVRKG